jgi:hypothetical protein
VKVAGANPFIAEGGCDNVTACTGSSTLATRNVTGPMTITVGTTNALASCAALGVELSD